MVHRDLVPRPTWGDESEDTEGRDHHDGAGHILFRQRGWGRAAMEVMDEDKRENGGDGYVPSWEMKREALTPAFTTDPLAFPVAEMEFG